MPMEKLVDPPHAAELCRGEVAELVDGDQHAENQDGRQDIHNGHGKAPVKRNTVTPGPAPPAGPPGPPPGCPPETDPAPQSTAARASATSRGISEKADLLCQEQAHGLLVGAVEDGAGGARPPVPPPPRGAGRETSPGPAGQRSGADRTAGPEAPEGSSARSGVGHGVADGKPHIRRAQLGQDRPDPVLHQGVDDALPVDRPPTPGRAAAGRGAWPR